MRVKVVEEVLRECCDRQRDLVQMKAASSSRTCEYGDEHRFFVCRHCGRHWKKWYRHIVPKPWDYCDLEETWSPLPWPWELPKPEDEQADLAAEALKRQRD